MDPVGYHQGSFGGISLISLIFLDFLDSSAASPRLECSFPTYNQQGLILQDIEGQLLKEHLLNEESGESKQIHNDTVDGRNPTPPVIHGNPMKNGRFSISTGEFTGFLNHQQYIPHPFCFK